MKKFALVCLIALMAASAQAGIIHDIQTGLAEEGTLQAPYDVVVVAVSYNGIWIAEEPFGAYDGIWVYMGSDEPIDLVPGDIVAVCGEYAEYFDLSELDVVAAGLYGSVVRTGSGPVPMPSYVMAADLMADPEPWESCAITIVDGMEVTAEPSNFGEWIATAQDGTEVMFDDVFYDDSTVALGDCYNSATGILNYSFGNFKLLAYADGINLTDCSVDTDATTFSQLKALFR